MAYLSKTAVIQRAVKIANITLSVRLTGGGAGDGKGEELEL